MTPEHLMTTHLSIALALATMADMRNVRAIATKALRNSGSRKRSLYTRLIEAIDGEMARRN